MSKYDLSPKPFTREEIEMITSIPVSGAWTSGTGSTPASGLGSLISSLGNTAHRQKTISDIVEQGYWIKMTGSRVTKDGWTDESDWDYVVYDPDQKLKHVYHGKEGWVMGSQADRGEFISIRKGEVNLILVDKEEVWKKYIIATNLIKTLNSKTKGERIAVFDSVFGKDSNAKAVEF